MHDNLTYKIYKDESKMETKRNLVEHHYWSTLLLEVVISVLILVYTLTSAVLATVNLHTDIG